MHRLQATPSPFELEGPCLVVCRIDQPQFSGQSKNSDLNLCMYSLMVAGGNWPDMIMAVAKTAQLLSQAV